MYQRKEPRKTQPWRHLCRTDDRQWKSPAIEPMQGRRGRKINKDYRISPFQAQGIQLIEGRVGEAAYGPFRWDRGVISA